MARKVKRTKVNRSNDGIMRQESTAGLMAMRIFVIFVIIAFIMGTAALFAYNLSKETANLLPGSDPAANDEEATLQAFDSDVSDELLRCCNKDNPIAESEEPELAGFSESIRVNSIMKESLDKLISAAAHDGIRLDIVRGYMTYQECDMEFKSLSLSLQDSGAPMAEAENRAAALFPPARENEYRTGLLIKVSTLSSDDFEADSAYKWLYKNGVKYGFINRYTTDKEGITGVTGDLTVYRFVGAENAEKMRSFGMCLEEYAEYCRARE